MPKIVFLEGERFWAITESEDPSLFNSLGIDSDEVVYLPHPHAEPDAKLEFPTDSEPSFAGQRFVASGAVVHEFSCRVTASDDVRTEPFSANELLVFDDCEMDFECLSVLEAHGWIGRDARPSREIIRRVSSIDGACSLTRAKIEHCDVWEVFILERAALHFAKPLSRLWYAANLRALYYVHYDDLRLGFLWAEYKYRMKFEANALRGRKVLNGARVAAEAVNDQHSEIRERRLARMAELVPIIGADKAAAQCELDGLGNWQAIKRQWHRSRLDKKKRHTRRCP